MAGLTIRVSVLGAVTPTDPGLNCPGGVRCDTGDSSVIPYPCATSQPSRAPASIASSADSGAAPEKTCRSADRSYASTSGCLASATTIGGATNERVIPCCWCRLRNCSRSKRGIVTTVAPARSPVFISTCMP